MSEKYKTSITSQNDKGRSDKDLFKKTLSGKVEIINSSDSKLLRNSSTVRKKSGNDGNKLSTSTTISKENSITNRRDRKGILKLYEKDLSRKISSEMVIQSIFYDKNLDDGNKHEDDSTSEIGEQLPFASPSDGHFISLSDDKNSSVSPDDEQPLTPFTDEPLLYNTDNEYEALSEEEFKTESQVPKIEVVFETISRERMTNYLKIDTNIKAIKEKMGAIFNVDPEMITLTKEGKECADKFTLSQLAKPPSVIKFHISSEKPKVFFSPGQFARYNYYKEDQIVKMKNDEGGFDQIVVKVYDHTFFQEWHGGYVNRRTNVSYYNKSVQTRPRLRTPEQPPLFSRDTQTPKFSFRDFTAETSKTKATQMWRSDCYIPTNNDKIIIGRPTEFKSSRVVIKMDLSRRISNRISVAEAYWLQRDSILETLYEQECEANAQKLRDAIETSLFKSNIRHIMGVSFPVNRDDFYKFYLMVGQWWNEEMKTVKSTKRDGARKAAVYELLAKEIEILSAIEKQRIHVKEERSAKRELSFLQTTSRPIIFRNNKGRTSLIDSVETQMAREYQEIMSSYLRTDTNVQQRIDMLQALKNLTLNYGCYEYSKEIIELIDRECRLLLMGMSEKLLKPLRKRIQDLLQFYLHDHNVNPAVKSYCSPKKPKMLKTMFQCKHCKRLKLASEFNVHVRMTSFAECRSCEWMHNISSIRINLAPYATLLQQVRETEMKNCAQSANSYVLQPVGMAYLVGRIWNNESIISNTKNMDELRMVRFRNHIDWSPWNCILLTLEESSSHARISHVELFYGKWLLEKIELKHLQAKAIFLPLILNDKTMRDSGLWFDVTDSDKFMHPSNIKQFVNSDDVTFLQK